jgi:hypothetical protein
MGKTSKTTLTTVVRGYKVEIDFNYSPPSKGARDSFNGRAGAGIQLEPDEPADIEITGVRLCDPDDLWEIITEESLPTKDELLEAIWKYQDDYDPT